MEKIVIRKKPKQSKPSRRKYDSSTIKHVEIQGHSRFSCNSLLESTLPEYFYSRFISKLRKSSVDFLPMDTLPSYHQLLSSAKQPPHPPKKKKVKRESYKCQSARFKKLNVGISINEIVFQEAKQLRGTARKVPSPRSGVRCYNKRTLAKKTPLSIEAKGLLK